MDIGSCLARIWNDLFPLIAGLNPYELDAQASGSACRTTRWRFELVIRRYECYWESMNDCEFETVFAKSLSDAQLWAAGRLQGGQDHVRLRSPELGSCHEGIVEPYGQSMAAVNALVKARSKLLEHADVKKPLTATKILCCDYAVSEASEASQVASHGYFNEFDLPPWDTWVAWFPDRETAQENCGVIISIVPQPCRQLVQLGIDANPVECIYWLDVAREPKSLHIPQWLTRFEN